MVGDTICQENSNLCLFLQPGIPLNVCNLPGDFSLKYEMKVVFHENIQGHNVQYWESINCTAPSIVFDDIFRKNQNVYLQRFVLKSSGLQLNTW